MTSAISRVARMFCAGLLLSTTRSATRPGVIMPSESAMRICDPRRVAAEIASIPEHIRGYGHVKEEHLHKAKAREAELLKEWSNPLRIVKVA